MKDGSREIVIRSSKEMYKVEKFVEEICDYFNINNEYFGNILLATTEASGILLSLNMKNTGKLVIHFDRSVKGLIFKIKLLDETAPSEREDYLDQEIRKHKLSKEIFIIKALADEIVISLSGKAIKMVFYVSSMNYEKSLQRINRLKEYWEQRQRVKQRNDE